MHLERIEEFSFDHGLHFNSVTGEYSSLNPHTLGRPLTHLEMDFNLLYQKQTLAGFRIAGSEADLTMASSDLAKTLTFVQISNVDPDWSRWSTAGLLTGQFIWHPTELVTTTQATTTQATTQATTAATQATTIATAATTAATQATTAATAATTQATLATTQATLGTIAATTQATVATTAATQATTQAPPAYSWLPYGNPNNENNGIGNWVTNDEGTTYEWQLAEANQSTIPAGQQIWWRVDSIQISGQPASPADFSGGVFPQGNFVTQTAGTVGGVNTVALWSVTIEADNTTEPLEQYDMKLYTDSNYTTELELHGIAQNYVRVNINDTSQATTTTVAPAKGYYLHGGNQAYPFAQGEGLTANPTGTLYYDDGSNAYASTTDLSVAMTYLMNLGTITGAGGYTIQEFDIAAGGITSMGTTDALQFPTSTQAEFYYIILPDTEVDLTDANTQHLVNGGIETNAIQRMPFTWNGNGYYIYKLGGGSQSGALTITFSDND